MSVVTRQGFKYSLVGYFGFLFGTLANLFVFPNDMTFYGTLRFVMPTAEIMLPIVVFGLSFSNVKFFHKAQKVRKHQNLLSLSLLGVLINFIIFLSLFFLYFCIFPSQKSLEVWKMKHMILPLIPILALSSVLNKYISNYKRIAIPNIFENLFPKIANLGAFSLFFFWGLSEKIAFVFYYFMFVLALLGYTIYANRLENLKLDFSTSYIRKNGLWQSIFNYSLFGFLGNIGNYIAFRIDNYMIGQNISMTDNGVYSTLLNILSILTISQMGISNISAPIINKCIEEQKMKDLDALHKKTSLSLFFLGIVVFSCILAGFPYLTEIMPNGSQLRSAEAVIWIIGSAILFDLATGFNGHIISLSKYYRFTIVVMLFLAITTIALNYIFLNYTHMGITGVALATAISLTSFNLIKILFNYRKFRVLPLTKDMLSILILCTISLGITYLLPESKWSLLNLFYKPSVILSFILIGNYYLKIYDLSSFLNKEFAKSLIQR